MLTCFDLCPPVKMTDRRKPHYISGDKSKKAFNGGEKAFLLEGYRMRQPANLEAAFNLIAMVAHRSSGIRTALDARLHLVKACRKHKLHPFAAGRAERVSELTHVGKG